MANRVMTKEYGNRKTCLKFNEFISTVVTVDDENVPMVDGKKVVPAGTIVGGKTAKVLLTPGEPVVDKVTTAVAAKLTTGTNDAAILWTANTAGAAGNSIKIVLVDPSTDTAKTTCSVTGTKITVTLAYETSAITATANDVVAAVMAAPEAAALVTCEATGTGEDTVSAKTETALANGADADMADYPEGVLLNDVDVTNGPREAAMIIWGFIDLDKIPPVPAAAYSMPGIKFLR